MTKRLSVLLWILASMIAAQAAFAAEPPPPPDAGAPTSLDDPYLPDAGDPDIFPSDDADVEEPGPTNPADD